MRIKLQTDLGVGPEDAGQVLDILGELGARRSEQLLVPREGRFAERVSNCLRGQAVGSEARCLAAFHTAWSRSIALRMVSSLRMHATMATFLGLPAASKRS